jgi:hypothetical protein
LVCTLKSADAQLGYLKGYWFPDVQIVPRGCKNGALDVFITVVEGMIEWDRSDVHDKPRCPALYSACELHPKCTFLVILAFPKVS